MKMITATHKDFIKTMLPAPGRDGIAAHSAAYNNLLTEYAASIAPQSVSEFAEEIELILEYIGAHGFAVLN